MSLVSDLSQTKFGKVIAVVFPILIVFLSGFMFLYQYEKVLFFKLDIFKLVLLSLAIVIPVWFFNLLVLSIKNLYSTVVSFFGFEDSQDGNLTKNLNVISSFVFSGLITSLTFYLECAAVYFNERGTKKAINGILLLEGTILVTMALPTIFLWIKEKLRKLAK